ncbi:MAG TPA: glycosyltransferase family 2 protein [Methylomirabilota bacterium]|nr:glycosyltransferase family 2 protein [Methylomirabilota bacterium]
MATVGLCMIVRNETHVIERCLSSLRGLIDHWTIVDTGSTDNTREKIRSLLSDVPGALHERPWRDFGHNRTEALALARPHADYSFIIDADERVELPPNFRWPQLTRDDYRLLHANGATRYWRTSLVNNRIAWRYVGVLHEYIEGDGSLGAENMAGPVVWGYFDGGRSVGLSTIEKYARDARTLEAALLAEPKNARYQFYLAQSYRDSRQVAAAIAAYEKRAQMGGWAEEVWYSLYQIAVLHASAGAEPDVVMAAHLRAFEYRPSRVEPLCDLAAYLRARDRHALAYLFASRARTISRPDDLLFLNEEAYSWRALDEFSIAAYWVGERRASAEACERLLASPATPAAHHARIRQNLAFARGAFAKAG